uniref:Uncharacterized protein n=1 Tax=Physcomitrium patens TaxID=3218 RepID=A0A2K1JWA3_PHYPA|nr:hypothetical protein PHYPA_015579 [Physcomitrium patens]
MAYRPKEDKAPFIQKSPTLDNILPIRDLCGARKHAVACLSLNAMSSGDKVYPATNQFPTLLYEPSFSSVLRVSFFFIIFNRYFFVCWVLSFRLPWIVAGVS